MTDPVPGPAATERQASWLRELAKSKAIFGVDLTPSQTMEKMDGLLSGGLTKAAASALIDQRYAWPRHPADQIPPTESVVRRLRDLIAYRALFGIEVTREETASRLEQALATGTDASARALLTFGHLEAKPYPTAKSALPLSKVEGIDGLSISEGHYAAMFEGTLRFYAVYTATSGALNGQVVMRRYSAANLLALYPHEAKAVLTTIEADQDAAAYRFADEFTKCWVCGRRLTDAVSRLVSLGPICRGFAEHAGLRHAAKQVDGDASRRAVFRALRAWAIDRGFTDPRSAADRKAKTARVSASLLASAWSGVPGVLTYGTASDVVNLIADLRTGQALPQVLADGLIAAPVDTIDILLQSGILAGPVLQALAVHPDAGVRARAGEFLLALLV